MVPYDSPWSFDEAFGTAFREHQALRLLGKFIGKDPARLSELVHVEYLALSRYPFTFELLAGFHALRVLELDFLQLKSLGGIERLDLKSLAISELRQLEDISGLRTLPLVGLKVALCNRVMDYGPIGDMDRLERLNVEAKQVPSLAFLTRLRTLRRLGLAVDKVDSNVVEDVLALSGLQWLGIRKRLLGRGGLERLNVALPNCKVDVW